MINNNNYINFSCIYLSLSLLHSVCLNVRLFFTFRIQNVLRRVSFPVVTSKSRVNYSTFFFVFDVFFFVVCCSDTESMLEESKKKHKPQIVSSIILECCLLKLCMKFVLTAIAVMRSLIYDRQKIMMRKRMHSNASNGHNIFVVAVVVVVVRFQILFDKCDRLPALQRIAFRFHPCMLSLRAAVHDAESNHRLYIRRVVEKNYHSSWSSIKYSECVCRKLDISKGSLTVNIVHFKQKLYLIFGRLTGKLMYSIDEFLQWYRSWIIFVKYLKHSVREERLTNQIFWMESIYFQIVLKIFSLIKLTANKKWFLHFLR